MVKSNCLCGTLPVHLKAWLLYSKPGFIWFTLLFILSLFNACKQSTPAESARANLPPITQVTTSLEDEVEDIANGQINWSTYWKLCWEAYPEAETYEIQTSTSEGVSPKLKKQKDTCYRIQIATGTNNKDLGMFNRDKLIKLQMGQLSYRIRAVLKNGNVSEWSASVPLADNSK
jgi:hypothetical protein